MKPTVQSVLLQKIQTDVLILGSGGAGLLAAIHAHDGNPSLRVTVASKGLIGKSGCTRMVQGGYNVALSEGDSIEAHFRDTIEGGKWINDQELAWTLVSMAPERVLELENRHGCFFDRNSDGTIHQKAFAGQTFDRTVHKGDLTGIEIMNRLTEQVRVRPIQLLEEHRAIELIANEDQSRISAVLMIDIRSGEFRLIQAKAVVVATGSRAHHVQVSHTIGRQILRRSGTGTSIWTQVARHGNGSVSPHWAACRHWNPNHRHHH